MEDTESFLFLDDKFFLEFWWRMNEYKLRRPSVFVSFIGYAILRLTKQVFFCILSHPRLQSDILLTDITMLRHFFSQCCLVLFFMLEFLSNLVRVIMTRYNRNFVTKLAQINTHFIWRSHICIGLYSLPLKFLTYFA